MDQITNSGAGLNTEARAKVTRCPSLSVPYLDDHALF